MQIFLSKQCTSFTGSVGRDFGYAIVHRKNGFFAKRNSKGDVPPDGHWRFILAFAQLAQSKLYLTDIALNWHEVYEALYEAHKFVAAHYVQRNGRGKVKITYNARDILNLKTTFGL